MSTQEHVPPPPGIRVVEAVALSDRGLVRRANEDSQIVMPPLYAVADGMGGARGGEVASSIAVATLRELAVGGDEDDAVVLRRAVEAANARIHERAQADPSVGGMGTTTTAVLARDGGPVVFAHVGDSRAYRLRDGLLQQLSDDHSLVGELVRRGALTPAEAERHPQRSIITRALGADPVVAVDVWTDDPLPDDVYLLCSDGLTGMVDDGLVHEILVGAPSLAEAARELVRAANAAGGDDNITVVLLRLGLDQGQTQQIEVIGADASLRSAPSGIAQAAGGAAGERRGRRRRGFLARFVVAVVAVGTVAAVGIGAVVGLRWAHFVGADGPSVAVYQGLPYDLPGDLRLYRRVDVQPALPVATLDLDARRALFDHRIESSSSAHARIDALLAGRAVLSAPVAAAPAAAATTAPALTAGTTTTPGGAGTEQASTSAP